MKKRIPGLIAAVLVMSSGIAMSAQENGAATAPNNDAGIPVSPSSGPAMNKEDTAAPAEESGGVGQTLSDAAITTSVKSKLIANSGTSGRNIKVTTENGVVVLSGHVKSQAEKTLAMQIASDTKGVKSVQDELVISGSS